MPVAFERIEAGRIAVVRSALDKMGLALANEHHEWTPELRGAYERAQSILDLWETEGLRPRGEQ